jgi:hypothetical protein
LVGTPLRRGRRSPYSGREASPGTPEGIGDVEVEPVPFLEGSGVDDEEVAEILRSVPDELDTPLWGETSPLEDEAEPAKINLRGKKGAEGVSLLPLRPLGVPEHRRLRNMARAGNGRYGSSADTPPLLRPIASGGLANLELSASVDAAAPR